MTGLDQTLCQVVTGASFGNAFLASLAVGQSTLDDISLWNPAAETISATTMPLMHANTRWFAGFMKQQKTSPQTLMRPTD